MSDSLYLHPDPTFAWYTVTTDNFTSVSIADVVCSCVIARKQEIIKVTEQLIESINNGDFEAYA